MIGTYLDQTTDVVDAVGGAEYWPLLYRPVSAKCAELGDKIASKSDERNKELGTL